MRVKKLAEKRLEHRHGLCRSQIERRSPAVNHDPAPFAVDSGNQALEADTFSEAPGELDIDAAIPEQGRTENDFCRAERQGSLRTFDGPDAAADPAGKRSTDVRDERFVAAGTLSRIEIDQLNLRVVRKSPHPRLDIIRLDRQTLALHELHDPAALEID